jgi:hypothetical protein
MTWRRVDVLQPKVAVVRRHLGPGSSLGVVPIHFAVEFADSSPVFEQL